MPEGPELFLSSLYINRTCGGLVFSGKVVKNPIHKCLDVMWNESAYTISAESKGKELMLHLRSCVDNVGGSKPHETKGCSILFTFGMSGKFEFTAADNMPKHSHLIFFTKSEPKMGLAFVDYRRFGKWVEGGQWSHERGPCVIQEHTAFVKNVAANLENSAFNKPICEVLLNQKFFNGIGNYLRAEILFRCNVPPFEKARSVLKLQEPKQEPDDTKSAERQQLSIGKKEMKIEDDHKNSSDGVKKISRKEERSLPVNNFKNIKEESPDPLDHCEMDLFIPKAQELLKLCTSIPLEVIDIGSTKYSLSELYKDDSGGKSFSDWLQCYYQEGMKNMADHNNRTIWFSGPAGPMAPKVQKVRGKKKAKTNKVSNGESKSDIDEQTSSKELKPQVKTDSPSSALTRTKLKEYKQKTTKGRSAQSKRKPSDNRTQVEKVEHNRKSKKHTVEKVEHNRERKKHTKEKVEQNRKRKKESTSDLPPQKKIKVNAAKRLTRSSIKLEQ